LDEIVVSGFEVERKVVFLWDVGIGFCERAFDDSLHTKGIGVDADVLVFDVEHVVQADFELAGVEVLLPPRYEEWLEVLKQPNVSTST
jgi:hypothetical protein